jgi:formylglycine-generating enzyme required for sulfatase activity
MEGLSNVANFSDGALGGWAFGRNEPGYNDGVRFSAPAGQFSPNAWGLCDMHGNVAEWTLSDYRLPQGAAANGNDRLPAGLKVVRGGSWFDTARFARSGSRWRYPAWQPVFNVGFRIVARPTRVAQK